MFLANNVQGTGSATTSGGFVVTATATASASSNISQADANTQALKLATSLAQSSAQNQANIMDQTIVINDSPAITPDTITLYYDISLPSSTVNFLNDKNTITLIRNRYMTNQFGVPNTTILTYFSYRTPAVNGLPNLYCETMIIKTQEGDFISALANYIDNGSSTSTTSAYENFAVTCANGIFAGYKNIRIQYNSDKTRVVTITN